MDIEIHGRWTRKEQENGNKKKQTEGKPIQFIHVMKEEETDGDHRWRQLT